MLALTELVGRLAIVAYAADKITGFACEAYLLTTSIFLFMHFVVPFFSFHRTDKYILDMIFGLCRNHRCCHLIGMPSDNVAGNTVDILVVLPALL